MKPSLFQIYLAGRILAGLNIDDTEGYVSLSVAQLIADEMPERPLTEYEKSLLYGNHAKLDADEWDAEHRAAHEHGSDCLCVDCAERPGWER